MNSVSLSVNLKNIDLYHDRCSNCNIVALLAINNVINVKLCVVKVTSAALFRPTMELFQNQRWEIL